ncbi:unnamed protein product [Caenorhabditis sp. 36 PRJEB53466]|nr:unnamed protein product [Caenorhabditis sp. 36 PRJEB53466]
MRSMIRRRVQILPTNCLSAPLFCVAMSTQKEMAATAMDVLSQAKQQFAQGDRIDVALLDQVVEIMNRMSGKEQAEANMILMSLKEDRESWTKVDAILQFSQLNESKYFALQILETVIQHKWKSLPQVQRDGIKSYIITKMLELSSEQSIMDQNQLLLHKLNLVLVQIVKQDWPKQWPSFITDIVESSKTNETVCINNMNILSLLSEEVFDSGSQNLTQAKEQHLKQQFCGQFQEVFTLCVNILEKCPSNSMVQATLKTLQRFLTWIPVGYVFETNITELLSDNFLSLEVYRVITLQCLTEISQIQVETNDPSYNEKLTKMFCSTMRHISTVLSLDIDLAAVYKDASDQDQKFINSLAQFLVGFIKEHVHLIEVTDEPLTESKAMIRDSHDYAIQLLLKITLIEEMEVFKVCLDCWCWLTAELYRISPFIQPSTLYGMMNQMREHPRRQLYRDYLSVLRSTMISRMAKPEEVLIEENDQGEVVREMVKDTDSIALYRNMRETLVYLTHLDNKDTEMKMTEKLASQVNGGEFSWKNLNRLCWAVGSISGTMVEEDEKRFLVLVIRDLLGLCEQKRGKDNKAVIASNIMYVVGQYPRFLRAHWKFLKTVINKLFEFMHETHEGVQDMACDTFIKIAIKCKRHFVIVQPAENKPFVEEMLENLTGIICDLSHSQIDGNLQEALITQLMEIPNRTWSDIIGAACANDSVLEEHEMVRSVLNILKTNVAACKSIGSAFVVQLGNIYNDLLSLYKILSEKVSRAVTTAGEEALKNPLVKTMRAVKREILILLSTFVSKNADAKLILDSIVPPLFDAVLFDYQKNVPQAREPKVLSLLSILVTQLGPLLSPQVPNILGAVFQCSIDMINKDMEAFPEHRTNFFELVLSLVQECFSVFMEMPPEDLGTVIDAVVWAFQHTMRNVAEIGKFVGMTDKIQNILLALMTQSQVFNHIHIRVSILSSNDFESSSILIESFFEVVSFLLN